MTQPPVESTDESRILSSSAVMAAGTVVSRMSGFVRSALLVAALGNVLHADLFNIGNTVPNMLYILVAGGIFNAVLVPQLVRSMRNDPDGGEAYANRVVTAAVLFLALVTVVLVLAAPWVMSLYLDPTLRRPGPGCAAGVGHRLRALLPAAGVLLRRVRPARPDPQLPRPVRSDDVGTDRQQRDRGRGPGDLPDGLRPGHGGRADGRVHQRSGGAARPGVDARHPRAAGDPAALPEVRRLQLPAAVRPPGHRPGPHPAARDVDGPLRGGQPDRLHRRRTPRFRWYGGRGRRRHRHRLHRLCAELPDRDGPPLGDHGLPGHGDPPPAQRPGERRRPDRPRPHPRDVAAQRAGRRPALRPPAAGDRPGHRPRGVGLGRRPRRVRAVHPHALPVRRRPAVLHRPLPDPAWVLRARAHAHGLLDPVRHRDHQRRGRGRAGVLRHRRGHLARAGARLHRVVRRRVDAVLPRPAAPARRAGDRGAWRGSWCDWSSRRASRPRRRTSRPWALDQLGERPEPGRRRPAGRGRHRPRRPRLRRGGAPACTCARSPTSWTR